MHRLLQLFAVCAALAGSFAFALAPAQAGAEGKRVAMFMGPTQDIYLGALSHGFETAATAAGMKVTIFSSPFDPALQAQQIDDAIAQKFDMFVVQIISQKAIVPSLTRVKNAKIPVVLVVVPPEGAEAQDLYVNFSGYDNTRLGTIAGDAMAKTLTDAGRTKGKIAIIAGSMAEGLAPLREQGFRAAIAKHPGLEVMVTEDVKWNPTIAEKASGQIIARFAGQGGLDGIYGMSDALANGTVVAAESSGVKLGTAAGSLVIVGGSCQAIGIKNLEAGKEAATVLVLPVEEGKLAAANAKDYFDGKSIEKLAYLPTEAVTKDNVAKHSKPCSF